MKFIIDRDMLHPVLQAARQIITGGKDAPPIQEHLLMERSDDRLSMRVVGPEMELRQVVPCTFSVEDAKEPLKRTAVAERMANICQSLPAGAEMRFIIGDAERTGKSGETDKTVDILITSGKDRYQLVSMDAEEFPLLPKQESQVHISLDWADLHFLFSKTGVCMATDDFRHYLNGMQLEFFPDRVRAVSSDSHRLAVCDRMLGEKGEKGKKGEEEAKGDGSGDEPLRLILPRRAVEKLQRFAPRQGEVRIDANANYIAFSDEERHFTCRLLEGKYPDYDSLLKPAEDRSIMLVDRAELQGSITRASSVLFADKETRSLQLDIGEGRVLLSASNRNNESSRVEMPVEDYKGGAMKITFRDVYLKQLIDLIECERVRLHFSSPDAGCLIKPEKTEHQYQYLLMPLRV